MQLKEGMIFTIEPMINIGKKDIKILVMDGQLLLEIKNYQPNMKHTVGVTKNGYEVFTLSKNP